MTTDKRSDVHSRTPPPGVTPSDGAMADVDDRATLRAALTSPIGGADTAATTAASQQRIEARAMASWADWQREQASIRVPVAAEAVDRRLVAAGASLRGGSGSPTRWRWALSGALLLATIAAWIWSSRPDPVLEELMRLDVLSQMTAGEM